MSVSNLDIKLSSYKEVENDWLALEQLAKPGYFQSSTWQSLWYEFGIKKGYDSKVLSILIDNSPALISSFVVGTVKILKFIPRRCAFLNASGKADFDVVCQEGCQPIVRNGVSEVVFDKFFDYLVNVLKVQEILANAIPAKIISSLILSCSKYGLELIEEQRSSHFWVNLESLRCENKTHLSLLTQRSRGIIRKTIDTYQSKFGEIKIQHASSISEALQWLNGLIDLNIARLGSKNQSSSFSYPFLSEFQKEIITNAFPKNEIVMCRVIAGDTLIGYIYGFLYNEFIYIYQAGFDFDLDRKSSPGLLAHHLLVQDALDRGLKGYDFLAGDYQYKRSLSNEEDELVWVRIRKPSLLIKLDRILRKLKRKILK